MLRAQQTIDDMEVNLDTDNNKPEQKELIKAAREFGHYIAVNNPFVPNVWESVSDFVHHNFYTIFIAP